MKTPGFWYDRSKGLPALALTPVSWLYRLGTALARMGKTPWQAPIPVICVGNIVAGGAGKTPVVLNIAGRLQARGINVHCLTRGYGGTERGPIQVDIGRHTARETGDEALLLARLAPTWVSGDRAAGARAAAEAGAEVLVMDDGFQNPSLVKDLSLVVVDGIAGFGNRRLIPAGPLRETAKSGMKRADAMVIVGSNDNVCTISAWGKPVLNARLVPSDASEKIKGKQVVAFAGIGRPEKFFDTLRALNCSLVAAQSFPDHHPYTHSDLQPLREQAEKGDAVLVTTEKDAVRLPDDFREAVLIVDVSLEWDDEEKLNALLDPLLP